MSETEHADQQARHDLVADTEQECAFEHRVTEPNRSGERDCIAAEQRELHAVLPLGDAIAHRRCAARNLRCRADLAGENLDLLGIAIIRRMRGEHVVISGDHSDINRLSTRDGLLVLARCGKSVRQIAA